MKKTILTLALMFTVIACDDLGGTLKSKVWFIPNVGSEDFLELFSGAGWVNVVGRIDIVGFNVRHLLCSNENEEGCPTYMGPNVFNNLNNAKAFPQLATWSKKVALVTKAVGQGYDPCYGALGFLQSAYSRIQDAKGTGVQYVLVDHPYEGFKACNMNPERIAKETSDFVAKAGLVYSSTFAEGAWPSVGVVETLSATLSADEIKSFVTAINPVKARMTFFHLNVDRKSLRAMGLTDSDIQAAIKDISAHVKATNIEFGMVMMGDESSSDQAYADSLTPWFAMVKAALGQPDHLVFQSTLETADALGAPLRTVPHNLTETDSSSHTGIIKRGIEFFSAP